MSKEKPEFAKINLNPTIAEALEQAKEQLEKAKPQLAKAKEDAAEIAASAIHETCSFLGSVFKKLDQKFNDKKPAKKDTPKP